MFDIGIGEMLLLAGVGLLVFGPERLPKAAADLARNFRHFRAMATNARKDLVDSAGVDFTDAKDMARDFASLHPRRLFSAEMLDEDSYAKTVAPKPEVEAVRPAFDPDAT